MLKLPNSIEPAVMAENIVHLRDAESSLDGRVSDLEVTAPKDYSTTETATGQKWVDGKDIYSITYITTLPEITASQNVQIGTLEVDTVVNIYSRTTVSTNNYSAPASILYNKMSGSITISNVSSSYSEGSAITVIYYTKPDPVPGDAKGPEDSDQEPEPEEKKTTRKTKK